MNFELKGNEFIELNKLLKLLRLVDSGGMAKQVIDEGLVLVNNKVELQKRKKLKNGDKVLFNKIEITICS
jgi:ribosome-associated protein